MKQIYYNGKILTMKGEDPEYVEAVKVTNGKIEKVGFLKELEEKDVQKINLNGATLMPSFIDAHSHITAFASTFAVCNVSTSKSFEEIVKQLKEYKQQNHIAKGEWIIGFGYDHNFLKEKEHPTKLTLDQVSKENPILITHASGHMGVVNSFALKELGIDENTKALQGGTFGRMNNLEELNGYLEENAFFFYSKQARRNFITQFRKDHKKGRRDLFIKRNYNYSRWINKKR